MEGGGGVTDALELEDGVGGVGEGFVHDPCAVEVFEGFVCWDRHGACGLLVNSDECRGYWIWKVTWKGRCG